MPGDNVANLKRTITADVSSESLLLKSRVPCLKMVMLITHSERFASIFF
jgi:hypothetical protein